MGTGTQTESYHEILRSGQRIGPYVIRDEIGRGAHGVVYRATRVDRPDLVVALKVIEDRGNLDRLLVEPDILSRLQHDNIVRLYDYFVDRRRVVLALEYIRGIDLKAYLAKRGSLSPNETCELLRQMALALDHAHGRDVVHRDIKLSNILVEERPGGVRYVLTDFGVSRIAHGIQIRKRTGGTYQFMAPEQLRGRPTRQSDLWALGVVAYVALCGRLPFQGHTLRELTKQVLYSTPMAPTGGQQPQLDRIIFKLLEKQVEGRAESAAELLRSLDADVTATPATSESQQRRSTWETQILNHIGVGEVIIGGSVLLAGAPSGFVGDIIVFAGAYAIYRGYERWRLAMRQEAALRSAELGMTGYVLLGILLMGLGTLVGIYLDWRIAEQVEALWGKDVLQPFNLLSLLWALPWSLLAVHQVVKLRGLYRELFLHRCLHQGDGSTKSLLAALRDYVDLNPGDLMIYQRYVETLLAAGLVRNAAIEACLMIRTDPFNVGANLILAQCYFDLGLNDLCVSLCDTYLSVVGYCFEFSDLRERALLTRGGSA